MISLRLVILTVMPICLKDYQILIVKLDLVKVQKRMFKLLELSIKTGRFNQFARPRKSRR